MNCSIWTAAFVTVVLICGCAGPRPAAPPVGDAELSRLTSTARAAYDRGSLPLAVTLYGRVLTRARALDDAISIGNAAYNLAVCRISIDDYEAARVLLIEAEAELTRAGANLSDVLLIEGKLAYWQGRHEDAMYFAGQVLTNPASLPAPAHRVEVALLKGSLACDDGDATKAKAVLNQARQEAQALDDTRLSAGLEQLNGRIQLLEKQPAAAARTFDREVTYCQLGRLPGSLVRALVRSGEAWQEAGQPALAADRFFRAARSSLAQGLTEQAIRSVELSVALAAEAGQDTLRTRALRLQADIMKSRAVKHP